MPTPHNMNQLPNFIFELAKLKDFDQLNEHEKKEVLQYLSREDYIQMREGTLILKPFEFNSNQLTEKHENKLALMQLLKTKKKRHQWQNTPIELWKVAASFVLLLMIGALFLKTNLKNEKLVYLTTNDTIYIKQSPLLDTIFKSIVKYDTIYKKSKENTIHTNSSPTEISSNYAIEQILSYDAIQAVKIETYGSTLNNKKGKNIKDDSLIQMIGFTTL